MKRQTAFPAFFALAALAWVSIATLAPATAAEPDATPAVAAPAAREAAGVASAGQAPSGRNLPDPTRPSAVVLTEALGAAPAEGGGLLRLQSVLLGKSTGRVPAALINGALVPLGGRVGDAKLMRLTEHGAVLQGPQGQTTLLLIAGVQKLAIPPRHGDADLRGAASAGSARVVELKP